MSRILNKAWAAAQAWLRKYGTLPSKNQVALVLAVAEHESGMGDAWVLYGARNWGASQLPNRYQSGRTDPRLGDPRVAFAYAIHGPAAAKPHIPDFLNGQIAMPPYQDARRFLYVDSMHGDQASAYWVFESGFGTDAEGCLYMLSILMRGGVTPAFLDSASTDDLAAHMKANGYYGVAVASYQAALRGVYPGILAGLATYDAGNPAHDPGSDDPLPIPATWGKAPDPSPGGGAPSGGSSSSGSSSGSGSPFRSSVTDTLDLEDEELELE